jgi:hypothetical protein
MAGAIAQITEPTAKIAAPTTRPTRAPKRLLAQPPAAENTIEAVM